LFDLLTLFDYTKTSINYIILNLILKCSTWNIFNIS